MITPTQQKIYNFICQYIDQHQYAPSLAEIAHGIGISPKSVSLVSRSIHALAAAGKVALDGRGYRNLRLVETDGRLVLPLVGRIAAGAPIEAIEDQQPVDLGPLLGGDDRFMLEVRGESMIGDGIFDGDLVICRRADQARENDIVVALIDGQEATLKRISYQISGRVTLIPANAALKPKAYLPHRVQIQGIFIGLLRLKK